MKKKLQMFLSIIILIPIMSLGGCVFYDDFDFSTNTQNTQVDKIDSYKIIYDDNNYQLDDTFEIYSQHILTEFYSFFGIINDDDHKTLSEQCAKPVVQNYDKIRVQTSDDDPPTINNEISWNWTLPQSLSNAEVLNTSNVTTAVDYYSNLNRQKVYFNAFIDAYKIPLSIVSMQICMGETPTKFTIEVSEFNVVVYFDSEKTQDVNAENSNVLKDVKQQFAKKSQYVGFTDENLLTFKDYILKNIVGDKIINTPFDFVKCSDGDHNYSEIIDLILKTTTPDLIKSFLDPYPACSFKDNNNSNYYVKAQGYNLMGHIPSYEYQSFIIIPKTDLDLGMIKLAFEAEKDLALTVKLNYYNKATKQTRLLDSTNVTIVGGKEYSYGDDKVFACDFPIISAFNNEKLSAPSPKPKQINNSNSNYFKTNENSTAILNGEAVDQNYLEIVFDIDRNSTETYYPFKFGISNLIAK